MSQAVDLNLFYDGSSGPGWYVVPLYGQQGQWRVTRGIDAGGSWPRPTKIECTINNDSLNYDPDRAAGTLYGKIGRNTPARLRIDGTSRGYAEATTYVPDRTVEHASGAAKGLSTVAFTAEGVLRRIGKWTDPLRSTMFRTISARSTSIGHWSIEDGRGAVRLSNSLPTGVGGINRGAELGDDDAPAGAASSAQIKDGSRLAGTFKTASTSAGWQVSWSFHADQLPPSAVGVELFRVYAANGYVWKWFVDNTSYYMQVFDSDGVMLENEAYTYGTGAEPTTWVTMRIAVEQVGGNVSWNWAWYAQDMQWFYVPTGTFAGTISRPSNWEQLGNATTDGWHVTQVYGVTGLTDDLMSLTSRRVFNGYKGETAGARFLRLCAELGITRFIIGASAETAAMGPQRPDTFLSLLREIMLTDDSIIYDERLTADAITMRTRRSMYSQAAVATFAYPADIAPPFRKDVGDTFTWNRVTVKNASGGEITVSQDTGRMSTQPPPAGVGEVKASLDVSVENADAQLTDRATWELAKGTLPRAAYTSVTIDLLANPGLKATVNAVNLGDRIDITGYDPDTISLRVVGFVDEGGAVERRCTFATEPYDPWDVGIWDDASFRYDARTSVLAGAQAAGATAWTINCTDPNDVWTTNAAMYPLDWEVAGERVRVPAPGPSAAGAAPTYAQTVTVQRAINGVSKAQLAGATVELADPKRWGY